MLILFKQCKQLIEHFIFHPNNYPKSLASQQCGNCFPLNSDTISIMFKFNKEKLYLGQFINIFLQKVLTSKTTLPNQGRGLIIRIYQY